MCDGGENDLKKTNTGDQLYILLKVSKIPSYVQSFICKSSTVTLFYICNTHKSIL